MNKAREYHSKKIENLQKKISPERKEQIRKRLSGTHNFTTETLWEIERVLHIQLVAGAMPLSRKQELEAMKDFVANEVTKALEKYICFNATIA